MNTVMEPRPLGSLTHAPPLRVPAAGEPAVLWSIDTGPYADEELALAADAVLDAAERERAAAFVMPAARRLYQGAHVALRLLIGAGLDRNPAELTFVREPCPCCDKLHGRPALPDAALHFSLSHSGEIALIGLAATPVGVDVERVPKPEVVAEVMSSLHPRELAELRALPAADRPVAFGRVWARKEAYLKGLGTGLGRDPGEDYLGIGPGPLRALPGWVIDDVRVPGYAAAVATALG